MKWFFLDAERRLRHAAVHPAYALKEFARTIGAPLTQILRGVGAVRKEEH